jgi:hypothetical protein
MLILMQFVYQAPCECLPLVLPATTLSVQVLVNCMSVLNATALFCKSNWLTRIIIALKISVLI